MCHCTSHQSQMPTMKSRIGILISWHDSERIDKMHDRICELAIQLAYKSDDRFRLGCVIAQKNRPVSIGYNSMVKTDPKLESPFKFRHAESHAIIGTPANLLSGSTLYVARIGARGRLLLAKPCEYCQRLIDESNIKRVFYSTEDGWQKL